MAVLLPPGRGNGSVASANQLRLTESSQPPLRKRAIRYCDSKKEAEQLLLAALDACPGFVAAALRMPGKTPRDVPLVPPGRCVPPGRLVPCGRCVPRGRHVLHDCRVIGEAGHEREGRRSRSLAARVVPLWRLVGLYGVGDPLFVENVRKGTPFVHSTTLRDNIFVGNAAHAHLQALRHVLADDVPGMRCARRPAVALPSRCARRPPPPTITSRRPACNPCSVSTLPTGNRISMPCPLGPCIPSRTALRLTTLPKAGSRAVPQTTDPCATPDSIPPAVSPRPHVARSHQVSQRVVSRPSTGVHPNSCDLPLGSRFR